MNWINRFIDQPLLEAAARLLRQWHIRTGQAPERLEPVWNLAVLALLALACAHGLSGRAALLGFGALAMLALPSLRKLFTLSRNKNRQYDAREYKAMRSRAHLKREAEWALRMTLLFAAAALPFLHRLADADGAAFMLGASLWFVLTGPLRAYLDAAEPPAPHNGDRSVQGSFQFG